LNHTEYRADLDFAIASKESLKIHLSLVQDSVFGLYLAGLNKAMDQSMAFISPTLSHSLISLENASRSHLVHLLLHHDHRHALIDHHGYPWPIGLLVLFPTAD